MLSLHSLISTALDRLAGLVYSDAFRYGRKAGIRAMRKERLEAMLAVLTVLVQASCLQFEGMICRVADGMARPLTVDEIVKLSGINKRNVQRCLHDLQNMGFLSSEKQFRRMTANGLMVAAACRKLTAAFWGALGLFEKFVIDVKQACAKAKLTFKQLLKIIPKNKGEAWKLSFAKAFTKCHSGRGGKPQSTGEILKQLSLA